MSTCDFLKELESQSVEYLSNWLEKIKPGHRERVNQIIRSFCNHYGLQETCVDLMLLNNYQNIGEPLVIHLITQERSLDQEEKKLVRRHPILSAHVLESRGFEEKIGADLFSEILMHHERWDGKGYFGVKGERIPLLCRILFPIDFFVAITSKRPHRPAVPPETALDEIHYQSGKMFDPDVVKKLVDSIENPIMTMGCAR